MIELKKKPMPCPFSHIPGNEPIKQYLKRIVHAETYPSSLLFAGHPSSQKEQHAEVFSRLILCKQDTDAEGIRKFQSKCHPDYHTYKPEGKMSLHSVDTMRQFREEVYLPPYDSHRKVFLIYEAERMLPASANALLKTFEEPPSFSVIILLSALPEKLLPTILSRCQRVHFQSREEEASKQRKVHPILLKLLKSPLLYADLVAAIEELIHEMEEQSQEMRKALEQKMSKEERKNLTAMQQEALEKEIEGVISLRQTEFAERLFDDILAWHRDLHLLKNGGDSKFLFLPQEEEHLRTSLQQELPALEQILDGVALAKKGLQRSTPLQYVLEGIFLGL